MEQWLVSRILFILTSPDDGAINPFQCGWQIKQHTLIMITSAFAVFLRAMGAHRRSFQVFFVLLLGAVSLPATTVVPPEFSQLVNESDYIVRATVKSVASEWRGQPGQGSIFTYVELEVREVIAGTPPQPLVLEMLGGKVGDQEMTVQGAPKFEVGQEDILFIQGNGRNVSPLFALMHGRYPVKKEPGSGREYVTRSNHVPLQDTAEVALPMPEGAAAEMQRRMKNPAQAMTPAQLVQRIKGAVNPAYRRVR